MRTSINTFLNKWKGKVNHLPLWDKVEIIDKAEN